MTKLDDSNIIRIMKLSSRKEDYLETIFRLASKIESVGISDIARDRGVTLPTVKAAVARLKQEGFLTQRHYGKVILTDAGREKAREVYRAHSTIHTFLTKVLGLPNDISEREACLMEHGLSSMTLERLQLFVDNMMRKREGTF